MNKFLCVISLLFILSSCSTTSSTTVTKIDLPLPSIKKIVVESLPEGRFYISTNGREFLSNEFYPHGKHTHLWYAPAAKNPRHYFAHMIILGSRRPYSIEVNVLEKSKKPALSETMVKTSRANPQLSKLLSERLEINLNKGLKELNVIDDFRVF